MQKPMGGGHELRDPAADVPLFSQRCRPPFTSATSEGIVNEVLIRSQSPVVWGWFHLSQKLKPFGHRMFGVLGSS